MSEVVKGFKVFNMDWTCRGFQYEVGKTYTLDGQLRVCGSGFHFCEKVGDCFNYYDFDPNNRVAEIEALGEVVTDGDKSATNMIRIVREITWAEMLELANTGKGNTGHSNAGNRNAGHYNAGDNNAGDNNAGDNNAGDNNAGNRNAGNRNAGHYNAGHYNAGDNNAGDNNAGDNNAGNRNAGNRNAGHYNAGHNNAGHYNAGHNNAGHYNAGHYNAGHNNAGHYNAGHYNAGHYNAGHYNAGHNNAGDNNAGDFNSCNWSTGTFCSVEQPFMLFNKVSPISRDELFWHPGMRAARCLRVVDDEGNAINYKKAWAKLWNDELGNPERIAIQSLPNFDADVFFEITGIRV